jgi:tripartite-type tricarboxylate transporter receptor subunit TctC
MKELVALLKASHGKYNYGSSGNGTILQDLVAGQIDFGVGALPAMQGQIKAGTIRAICVSAPARIPAASDIPTAIEQGYPKYLVEGRIAVIGRKGNSTDAAAPFFRTEMARYAATVKRVGVVPECPQLMTTSQFME